MNASCHTKMIWKKSILSPPPSSLPPFVFYSLVVSLSRTIFLSGGERQTGRGTDRHVVRQTGQTDRQTDRQTGRHSGQGRPSCALCLPPTLCYLLHESQTLAHCGGCCSSNMSTMKVENVKGLLLTSSSSLRTLYSS
jgi:hypothetical protein